MGNRRWEGGSCIRGVMSLNCCAWDSGRNSCSGEAGSRPREEGEGEREEGYKGEAGACVWKEKVKETLF